MIREDRAKQFMPFDALKGLQEELRKREDKRLKENKRDLKDEEIMWLTRAINALKKGMKVKVTYYNYVNERYVTFRDVFQNAYRVTRTFKKQNYSICFDDLLNVEILSE